MSRSIWIWGRHPVLEAIRAGSATRVLVASGRRHAPVLDEIQSAAAEQGVELEEVALQELERLAPGQNTQGVAAQITPRRVEGLSDLLARTLSAARQPFLIALDQIQDPHNLGALLRTADAAGVQGALVPARRSAPLSGVVAKASAGAISYLPVVEVPNLVRALEEVRSAGIWTIGLEAGGGESIFKTDLTVPVTLVIGSEGMGLRRLTREHCDLLVTLPMLGKVESLNASVAGSIAMYETVRQRIASGERQ